MPGAARPAGRPPAAPSRAAALSPYRWVVLTMAFVGVFGAIGFGRFGYSAILPTMQNNLGISSAAAGSLASWNLGGYMSMAFIGGMLAARLGPRIVVTVGLYHRRGEPSPSGRMAWVAASPAVADRLGSGTVLGRR